MTAAPVPPEARAYVDLIGVEATLALIAARGGTRLYVPKVAAGSEIAGEIGDHAAGLLAAEYGGTYLNVPLVKAWRAAMLKASGRSYADIARAIGSSESGVYKMLARAGMTHSQLDLFQR